MTRRELDHWFTAEILPLEPMLVRFLRRNWRDESEVADLRQEAYIRAYKSAQDCRPLSAKAFLFRIVHNLMIDKLRHSNVVQIEMIADIDALNIASDDPGPERHTSGRQEMRNLQAALDNLPPRCREVVILRKIEGLSQREIAARMRITENTVERHLVKGMEVLARSVFGSRRSLIASAKRQDAKPWLRSR